MLDVTTGSCYKKEPRGEKRKRHQLEDNSFLVYSWKRHNGFQKGSLVAVGVAQWWPANFLNYQPTKSTNLDNLDRFCPKDQRLEPQY